MTQRLIALPVLLVLLVVGIWILLSGGDERGDGGRGQATLPDAPTAPADVEEPAPGLALAESPPAQAPVAERTAPVRTEAAPVEVATLEAEYTSFDTEGARWIDVTVVIPAGCPPE